MVAHARARFLRISPRKLREVADIIRGMRADEALLTLQSLNKRAAKTTFKVISAAIANAKQQNTDLTEGELHISKIVVDGGPFLKRFRAAAMGRATTIRRRTSHLLVELDKATKKESRRRGGREKAKDLGKTKKSEGKAQSKKKTPPGVASQADRLGKTGEAK